MRTTGNNWVWVLMAIVAVMVCSASAMAGEKSVGHKAIVTQESAKTTSTNNDMFLRRAFRPIVVANTHIAGHDAVVAIHGKSLRMTISF